MRVALIIIGDEILTGKYRDENGPWLIERLRARGVDLARLVTIPDLVAEIAEEVLRCSQRYDAVITSGGVGPTHDDLTMEGVAQAFGQPLEERQELLELIERYELPSAGARRMSLAPVGAELIASDDVPFPVLKVHNVYVFPGVPKLFRAKFGVVAERFRGPAVHTARVLTLERETEMAERLAGVAQRHPQVSIGSYPRFGEGRRRVVLTLESRSPEHLAHALEDLATHVHLTEAELAL